MSNISITQLAADVATMQLEHQNLKAGLDSEFLIRATTLIFTMQIGFVMLEGGFVRRLNITNIVAKNVADFGIGAIAFFFVGWGLSGLSASRNGLSPSSTPASFAGPGPFAFVSDSEAAQFQFHFAFASTASTIVSGGCAERIRIGAYAAWVFLNMCFIYPIGAYWVWSAGGWLNMQTVGHLGTYAYIDFAGGSVVHLCGAIGAFVATTFLGPRKRSWKDRNNPMYGSSAALAMGGTLVLWIGWYSFNGGSTQAISTVALANTSAKATLSTSMGAAGGMVAGFIYAIITDNTKTGMITPEDMTNGILGGLVSITAGAHVLNPLTSLFVAFLGGLIACFFASVLEAHGIDDPVGAITVHGPPAVFGVLAIGIFASFDSMKIVYGATSLHGCGLAFGGGFELLGVQAVGVLALGAFFFVANVVVFWVLDKTIGIRVGVEAEVVGLDVAQHNQAGAVLDEIKRLSVERLVARKTAVSQFVRRAKVSLRSTEDMFFSFTNSSMVGIFQFDPSGRVMYSNEKFARLCGISNTSDGNGEYELNLPILPGRYPQWVRNIHPDDKKRVLDAWVRAVETRSDFKCQWRYKNTLKDNAGARDFIFVLANAVAIDNFVRDAEYLTDKSGVKQLEYIAGSGPAEVADLESPAKSSVPISKSTRSDSMLDLEWFGTLTDVTELIERDEVERAKQQRRKFYLTSFWKGTRVCEDAKDIVRDLLELIQLVLGTDAVAMTVVGENKASGVGEPAEGGSGTNGSAADKGKENESNDVFLVAGVGIDCARLGTALGRSDDKTWFTGAVLQCQEPVLYRKEVVIGERDVPFLDPVACPFPSSRIGTCYFLRETDGANAKEESKEVDVLPAPNEVMGTISAYSSGALTLGEEEISFVSKAAETVGKVLVGAGQHASIEISEAMRERLTKAAVVHGSRFKVVSAGNVHHVQLLSGVAKAVGIDEKEEAVRPAQPGN